MSLSVKISGEDVANLSAATGKNDTEMGSHACGLFEGMILHTSFCESNWDSVRFKNRIQCNAKFGSQFQPSPPLNLQQISFEATATVDTPVWRASVGDEKTRGCRTKLYLRLDSIQP